MLKAFIANADKILDMASDFENDPQPDVDFDYVQGFWSLRDLIDGLKKQINDGP